MMRCPDPYCSSTQSKVVYDFGKWKIVECKNCKLMYLTPFPTLEELKQIYNEEYYLNKNFYDFQENNLYGYTDYITERFTKQLHYRDIVGEIKRFLPKDKEKRTRLLEVGCGLGFFLDVASDCSFDVTGIEFNEYAIEFIKKKYAFDVRSGELEKGMFGNNTFDVVAMFDVIEHLRNAFSTIEVIHDILSPEGILVLTTMDSRSLVSRLLGKRLEDFRRTKEHLFFFSRETITNILAKYGFEIIKIQSNPHTFEMGILLERSTIYSRPIFRAIKRLFDLLKLSKINIHVNLGTKMIVYARKSANAS
jgi:2-polyprenyl-3-methyl-5-hydroxy-6-metoxy-1,4-benzoquinol methylase